MWIFNFTVNRVIWNAIFWFRRALLARTSDFNCSTLMCVRNASAWHKPSWALSIVYCEELSSMVIDVTVIEGAKLMSVSFRLHAASRLVCWTVPLPTAIVILSIESKNVCATRDRRMQRKEKSWAVDKASCVTVLQVCSYRDWILILLCWCQPDRR